jgi:hypothetical protein
MLQLQHNVANKLRMGGKFYTEDAENRILAEIIGSGKEGIYQKDILARITGIHRSTVNRVARRFEENGKIKIIRKGKTARYVALNDAQVDVGIGASILGKGFTSSLFFGNEGMILSDCTQVPQNIDFSTYRHYFQPNFTEYSKLEKTIFEFTNQIGAFIIYIFIQAMNNDNINKLLLLKKRSKKASKNIIEIENQNRFVTEEWIENAIAVNLIQMLWKFNHVLKPFGFIPNVLTKEGS